MFHLDRGLATRASEDSAQPHWFMPCWLSNDRPVPHSSLAPKERDGEEESKGESDGKPRVPGLGATFCIMANPTARSGYEGGLSTRFRQILRSLREFILNFRCPQAC